MTDSPLTDDPMTDSPLTLASFQALREQPFSMRLPDGSQVALRLQECSVSGADADPSAFALTFAAGSDGPLEQSTYPLSAAGFGPVPIFLVPLRQLPDGVEYQAVFNNPK